MKRGAQQYINACREGMRSGAIPNSGSAKKLFFFVTASRTFPTSHVTTHLKTLFCYRKQIIAHPAATLPATPKYCNPQRASP